MTKQFAWTLALVAGIAPGLAAQRGGRGQGAPPTGRAAAPVDLTGYWVSVVTEDWRFRMVTPPKGDYASVPISQEGRRVADTWDPSKDGMCEAYGAAGLMRMPGRLHITWEDDTTLKIEADAGQQTRLLHFGAARPPSGERTLQGYSTAQWVGGAGGALGGFGGFGGNVVAPDSTAPGRGQGAVAPVAAEGRGAPPAAARGGQPPAAATPAAARGVASAAARGGGGDAAGRGAGAQRWGELRATTTQLKPGWLRKNGVPYSENTTMTENFIRFSDGADEWFTVSTIVEDPTYLTQSFITSTNFKREPDGSKFKPTTCKTS
jgi:hypothetical protein